MAFGRWLEEHMDRLEVNQDGLAQLLGVNHVAVHRWIYGKRLPSIKNVERLAQVLDVRREDVFRALGWIKSPAEYNEREARLVEIIRRMSPEARESAETFLQELLELQARLEAGDRPDTEDKVGEGAVRQP